MSLGGKLAIVFCAFLAVLAAVIWMSFRERRLSRRKSPTTTSRRSKRRTRA